MERTTSVPQNEDGEFELVLGNKQLLSVFFIVVILLGVFFTMGYILGRNSAPMDSARRAGSAGVTPPKTDLPSAMGTRTQTPAPEPAAETPKPAPADTEAAKPAEKPIESATVNASVVQPVAGATYVQVLAVAKPEAEVLVEVLAKKGMRAIVAPGPTDKIFRVLVGPVKDEDVPKVKGDLETAGFKGAFPKRY